MSKVVPQTVVEQWVEAVGLEWAAVDLEDDNYTWGVSVTGQRFALVIAHRSVDHSNLFLQVDVGISPEHLEALSALGETDRHLFYLDLRLLLHGRPVGHSIDFEGDPLLSKKVTLGYNMLEDPPTLAGFLRRNHQLQGAAHMVALTYQKMAFLKRWPA